MSKWEGHIIKEVAYGKTTLLLGSSLLSSLLPVKPNTNQGKKRRGIEEKLDQHPFARKLGGARIRRGKILTRPSS